MVPSTSASAGVRPQSLTEARAAGDLARRLRVPTSTKGFKEWGGVLGDEIMAAALIDSLLHHCHIVNIRGNSYRTRNQAELARVHSGDEPAHPATEEEDSR